MKKQGFPVLFSHMLSCSILHMTEYENDPTEGMGAVLWLIAGFAVVVITICYMLATSQ
jgi:hypothetical protein